MPLDTTLTVAVSSSTDPLVQLSVPEIVAFALSQYTGFERAASADRDRPARLRGDAVADRPRQEQLNIAAVEHGLVGHHSRRGTDILRARDLIAGRRIQHRFVGAREDDAA
jgi:hypothetical protein